MHRGQALSEEEQRSYRELKDGVEDLNAEMEYLDGSISQVRKRVAKADGLVVRTSLEQINLPFHPYLQPTSTCFS